MDYLERKDAENEAKLREQGEVIIQLKAKMDAKLESIHSSSRPSRDKLVTDLRSSINSINNMYLYRGVAPSDDSPTRAVAPSSCRELSMIGHILDGLYLVQNPDTKKVETVFCTFGTSSKSDWRMKLASYHYTHLVLIIIYTSDH